MSNRRLSEQFTGIEKMKNRTNQMAVNAVPFSAKDALGRYLPLMHELATRIDLVAQACNGNLGLPLPFAREYVYLQFRQVCELIALGSLQLHGDLPQFQTQAALREWNAEKIMRLLERHHPHCFPQSAERIKTSNGWAINANSIENALTFSEFKKLYAECGEALHRGTIRSIQSSKQLTQTDYQGLITWQSKIVALMNEHLVGRASEIGFYLVSLRTDSGFPEASIFTKDGDAKMNVEIVRMEIQGTDYENHMLVGNMKLATTK
ncbi:hypothetical protein [Variovorax sp. HJSM1_2]|uniref:hypothetical protein n=1 Tax=Variovorax sp. HJSM1_2 TaxID=3366263 RepID=UPI003BC10232